MATLFLGITALVVGFFCGCTSIGGILLIPGIVLFSSLGIHEAMATALFTFAIMAVLGTCLHWKKGSLRPGDSLSICLGALLSGYAGARANAFFAAESLNLVLALLVFFAGASSLVPAKKALVRLPECTALTQHAALLGLGLLVGFMAGLTGIGGPVLSVPFMIFMGYAPLLAVAVAQPLQLVAGVSGSVSYILSGSIDYTMGALLTVVELAGFYLGIGLAYRMNGQLLRIFISLLCIGTGIYLLLR